MNNMLIKTLLGVNILILGGGIGQFLYWQHWAGKTDQLTADHAQQLKLHAEQITDLFKSTEHQEVAKAIVSLTEITRNNRDIINEVKAAAVEQRQWRDSVNNQLARINTKLDEALKP